MNPKLPYYMAYPMPLAYDDEKIERRDFEYMKSLYPAMAKKVLPYVEDECDRMEYDCSMMYDEYPDKLQLRMMCSRIYDNVRKHEKMFYGEGYEDIFPEEMMEEQAIRRPDEDRLFRPDRRSDEDRPFRPDRRLDEDGPFRPDRRLDEDRPFRPDRRLDEDRPFRPDRRSDEDRPFRSDRRSDEDRPSRQDRPSFGNGGQNWLRDMVEVMLYQELYKRRCDNRRCRRKFY